MHQDTMEQLKGFDCLMICIQLALSWDERMLKKLFRKHGLLKANPDFDPAFALYQLHHEFHDPDSRITAELVRHYSKQYRTDTEFIRNSDCDVNSHSLLETTTMLLRERPAGLFWAMATDKRLNIHALSSYHAHRLILDAFQPSPGSVFAFEQLKRQAAEQKEEIRLRKEEATALNLKLEARNREIAEMRTRLAEAESQKRELRKLRYELGRQTPPAETGNELSPINAAAVTVDPPCPFRRGECCEEFAAGRCTLENLKVALIGGLDRLENQYRSTFERLGVAKFFFHTGCCAGGGAERLRATTEAADIVVFVTRVNSHNALSVLKGVCRKSGKSILAVRATGPDQISQIVLKELNRAGADATPAAANPALMRP